MKSHWNQRVFERGFFQERKEVNTLEYSSDLEGKVYIQTGIFDGLSLTSSGSKTDMWR